MAHRDGRPTSILGLLAIAALVSLSLAGCLSQPSTELTSRRGDLARAELVVANGTDVALPNGTDGSVADLCGQPIDQLEGSGCPEAEATYVLLEDRPAAVPEGYEDPRALPGPLLEHLEGLREGEDRLREDVQAWGPHRDGLVREHEREDRVPRIVEEPDAYGREWNTTRLENGSHRIEPTEADRGASLSIPDWCNERFCLFTSQLLDWTDTHLVVEHQARVGQSVHVRELDTSLAVTDADETSFTIDGNDARAGERYDVYVRLTDVRGPAEGEERAPSFELTTVDGQAISLDEMLGRPVVVEFFATWCPSCRENADHLADVRERFGDDVAIVSIDVDPWESTASIQSFAREHDVTWPVAVDEDGTVSRDYGVGTLSTEVLVDPQGVIRHVETGVADHDRVVSILEDLLPEADEGSG